MQQHEGWDLRPQCVYGACPSSKCIALFRDTLRAFPAKHTSEQQLQEYIATAMYTSPKLLTFGKPQAPSTLHRYVRFGFLYHKIVAAVDRSPEVRPDAKLGDIVFIDPRQLGKDPTFLFLNEGWHSVHGLLGFLAVRPPQGFQFEVTGIPTRPDEIYVTDCCTVVVTMLPERAASDASPSDKISDHTLRNHRGLSLPQQQAVANLEPTPEIDQRAIRNVPVPVPIRQAPEGPPDPEFINASFLVVAPGYTAEVIQLVLRAPCSLEDALNEITSARDCDRALSCDHLVPPLFQPDNSFGVILALPGWAEAVDAVLVDARALDNRLFTCVFQPIMSRQEIPPTG